MGQLLTPAEAASVPPAPCSQAGSCVDDQVVTGSIGPCSVLNIVNEALRIARHRYDILGCLRTSLKAGNNEEALKLARRLCGLEGQ